MKRTILLLSAGIVSLFEGSLNGCGWYYSGEDFRFWLLQPELMEATALAPFSYNTQLLAGYDPQKIAEIGRDKNIAEWRSTIGLFVEPEDVEAILYGMSPLYFSQNEEALFKENAFLKRLAQLKGGWPEFIRFAKRCEELVNAEDPWGFDAHDGAGIDRALASGAKQLKKARHPQLKARLAYQQIRLLHYRANADHSAAQKLYDTYLLPLKGNTWLESSAAFYVASMLPLPQRDLAYADCFDRATDKQFRMVQLFDSQGMESYRIHARTDKQRATLLVMRGLQHPGRMLEDLERIAAYDPGNEHLPMLLAREVNKVEDWLLTPELTELGSAINLYNYSEELVDPAEVVRTDLAYLHAVQGFINKVSEHATVKDKTVLRLLNGHLSFVAGDLDECRKVMGSVVDDPNVNGVMRLQARMDDLLCQIMRGPLTDDTKADIMATVELINTDPSLTDRRSTMLDQLHLYLGKKLALRGEMAEGIFLLARTGRMFGSTAVWGSQSARYYLFLHGKPADYDRMIALLEKPDKTPFEQYLTGTDVRPDGWEYTENRVQQEELNRNKLLDYKSTWYVDQDRLEEAAAIFRQIPDSFWTGYPYAMFNDDDPFVVNIDDPHNYNKSDSVRYNKRTIVERMVALKKEADRNPSKRGLNHYLLGNAYYNMSWHGKYWIMSRIDWTRWGYNGGTEALPSEQRSESDDRYFGTTRAEEHYAIALRAAKDPVLKALACRMAAECNNNMAYYSGETESNVWEDPYRDELTDAKSQEAYARIEDCSGYADFVRRYR